MGNTVCCTEGGNDNSNNQMDYADESLKRQTIDGKKKTINRNKTKKREQQSSKM
jgi:hypothetical protein